MLNFYELKFFKVFTKITKFIIIKQISLNGTIQEEHNHNLNINHHQK
jgi:hypothetical protein